MFWFVWLIFLFMSIFLSSNYYQCFLIRNQMNESFLSKMKPLTLNTITDCPGALSVLRSGSLEALRARASTEQRPCVWRAPLARRPPSSASSTSAAATTHRWSLTDAATRCGSSRRSPRTSSRWRLDSTKKRNTYIYIDLYLKKISHFMSGNPVALTVSIGESNLGDLTNPWTHMEKNTGYPCCLYSPLTICSIDEA